MKNPLTQLSIRNRLLIIMAVFLLPILILAYELNTRLEESIAFSTNEQHGAKMTAPLQKLLNLFADYQMPSLQKANGDNSVDGDIAAVAGDIDQYLAKLVTLDEELGAELDMTPEGFKKHGQSETLTVANLKQKWEAAKTAPFSRDAFQAIMADVTTMIKHVGNASGLILDGDLDTYYIIDASFNAFPATTNTLTKLQIDGYEALHKGAGKAEGEDAIHVGNIADELEHNFVPHIHDSITTALHEDANFHEANANFQADISKKLADYDALSKEIIATVRKLESGAEVNANEYVEIVDKQHNATSTFARATLASLDSMIETRLADLRSSRNRVMGLSIGIVCLAFLLSLVISNSISSPLKKMTETMKKLSDGDTSVEIPSTNDGSEVGAIAKSVLVFKDNMIQTDKLRAEQEQLKVRAEAEKRQTMNAMADGFESSVKSVVTEVSASATQMQGNAERLSTLAGETKSNSAIVSSSATTAAQTATQVAAAAEELTAAIGEISAQVQKSSTVANQASSQAESINQSMHLLVEKSNRVGEVIQFITNIASQINLLALNATIESARAGEAGRGFAVVASEVKNLANQTAKATEEIVQQVQSMQEATQGAVQSVGEIISIINEISQSTAGVAAAVEEQSAATNEISRNIAHTAQGTSEISRSITAVEQGAEETGSSSRQVLDSAKMLTTQAATLSQKVDEFLRTVRAS